jgi:hypothetical protein
MSNPPSWSDPFVHPERLALSETVSTPTKREFIELRISHLLAFVSLAVLASNLLYDLLKFALIVSLSHWGQL